MIAKLLSSLPWNCTDYRYMCFWSGLALEEGTKLCDNLVVGSNHRYRWKIPDVDVTEAGDIWVLPIATVSWAFTTKNVKAHALLLSLLYEVLFGKYKCSFYNVFWFAKGHVTLIFLIEYIDFAVTLNQTISDFRKPFRALSDHLGIGLDDFVHKKSLQFIFYYLNTNLSFYRTYSIPMCIDGSITYSTTKTSYWSGLQTERNCKRLITGNQPYTFNFIERIFLYFS